MGQGTSRQEPSSRERQRPSPSTTAATAVARPASTLLDSSNEAQRSINRSRRHSSFLGHLSPSLHRSITDPLDTTNFNPQSRSWRSRFIRPQSSLTSSLSNLFYRHATDVTASSTHENPSQSPSTPSTLEPLENYLIPNTPAPQVSLPTFQESLEASLMNSDRNIDTSTQTNNSWLSRPRPESIDSGQRSFSNTERGFRGMTASLRRRRSPLPREDTSALLTRLLTAAAAATAMSLTGNTDTTINDLHSATGTGIDGDDGSFHGFLQSLRNGRLASLGQVSPADGSVDGTNDQPPVALEFFRMFRFGTSQSSRRRTARSSSRPSSSRSLDPRPSTTSDGTSEVAEGDRMVPVLIVGIRALNDNEVNEDRTGEGVPSFLDSLAPTPQAVNVDSSEDTATSEAESSQGSRRSRRTTIGGFNFFSPDRNNQRHDERSRPTTSHPSPSETPPGPHPPPTTPASPLSALSSGTTTPTRRSSLSLSADGTHSRRESLYRRLTGATTLEPTLEENQSTDQTQARQRGLRRTRRIHSWTDMPRHDPRRNGVLMEPSDITPAEGSSTRSWIIYILGGNYPENHPILTTPSLFTDSPTYEDMLLLSNLLGSAKPPVADAEDVSSAGGVFKVSIAGDALTMNEIDGEEMAEIATSERCLVCLCEYEDAEDVRRLTKCKHYFHKECIDQWLTTGRNSCPLCRSQGVDEKERATPPTEGESASSVELNTS